VKNIILPNQYPYFFDTHVHTNKGSACAGNDPIETVKTYKRAGYSGVVITEHNWGGNTRINRRLYFKEWVKHFILSYQEAYSWGEKNNFVVLWGYEAGYSGTEFLIHGLKPDFLFEYPEIRNASIEEQYQIVHAAGGIVVHAHPFREAYYIPEIYLNPEYIDAVEWINGAHYNRISYNEFGHYIEKEMYNRKALAYAREHDFPMTAGSDTHSTNLRGVGMAFKNLPGAEGQFVKSLLSRQDYLLTDGFKWYDPFGKELYETEYE